MNLVAAAAGADERVALPDSITRAGIALAVVLPGDGRPVRCPRRNGVGRQPLRSAAAMTLTGWLRRYAAHPDPATAAGNVVALVVAGNGPFYPVYALALIGWEHSGVWLTMLVQLANVLQALYLAGEAGEVDTR